MTEALPNVNGAATAFDPALDASTKHHDLPPTLIEKGEPLPDSSNTSTQFKSDGDEANEKAPLGDQPGQVRKITGIKWVLAVFSILSSTFLYALDNTVVADIQPQIVERFGEIQKLPWLPIGFLVACVSTNLIWYVD